MLGIQAYGIYLGLKLHFDEKSYDYEKYGPKKVREESLGKQYVFVNHLAGKYHSREELEHDLVALMKWDNVYLNQVLHEDKKKPIKQHEKDIRLWREYLKRDLAYLTDYAGSVQDSILIRDPFSVPPIGRAILNKEINVESYLCLDYLLDFNSKMSDLCWGVKKLRLEKYKTFFRPRLEDVAKIARPFFDRSS